MEDNETLLDKLFEIRSEEFNATITEEHKKLLLIFNDKISLVW